MNGSRPTGITRALRAGLGLVLGVLVACHQPLARPDIGNRDVGTDNTPGELAKLDPSWLVGHVDYPIPADRTTQATVGDMLSRSTISLLDATSGQTIVATISDTSGNFALKMPGFVPVANTLYVVEAVKGLGSQLPGRIAPRLRTIMKYNGSGWLSLVSSVANASVVINADTTAVAITGAIDPIGLPLGNAMGKVKGSAGGGLNAAPAFAAHPDSELTATRNDVVATLAADSDPVAQIDSIQPVLQGVNPTSGSANTIVALKGTGFGGTSTVALNGTTIPTSNVLMSTRNLIVITVPVGAQSGNLTVTARGSTSAGIPFTVPNSAAVSITSVSPNPVRPLASVTITGTGFSTTASSNTVTLNGLSVTPDSANQTSLVFRVPSTATSGNLSVSTGGQTSNAYYVTVDALTTPQISKVWPSFVTNRSVLEISGSNLGPNGAVLIGDFRAEVISWNPNIIRVRVPWYVGEGQQVVTVFAPLGVQTSAVNVIDGNTTINWVNISPSMPGDVGGAGFHAHVGGRKLWVWGGNGSTKVYSMALADDGSFQAGATWQAAPFAIPEGTYQDDNPNSRVQIKNRVYYTVTNQLGAWNKSHINFATLDPYTGDIIGFAYDPINDLPPTWAGKDLALVASDRYVYIMGHGVSCTSDGVSCGNNNVGTMEARLLESGNIGKWETGPNQVYYGEDGQPFIIGDSLYMIGGTSGVSQQSVIRSDGKMSPWNRMGSPLIPDGHILSTMVMQVGRYYYLWSTWSDRRTFRGGIVDNLVPQVSAELSGAESPQATLGGQAIGHIDVHVGKYVYLLSTQAGGYGSNQGVVRGEVF